MMQLVLARATDCAEHEKPIALSGYFTGKKKVVSIETKGI